MRPGQPLRSARTPADDNSDFVQYRCFRHPGRPQSRSGTSVSSAWLPPQWRDQKDSVSDRTPAIVASRTRPPTFLTGPLPFHGQMIISATSREEGHHRDQGPPIVVRVLVEGLLASPLSSRPSESQRPAITPGPRWLSFQSDSPAQADPTHLMRTTDAENTGRHGKPYEGPCPTHRYAPGRHGPASANAGKSSGRQGSHWSSKYLGGYPTNAALIGILMDESCGLPECLATGKSLAACWAPARIPRAGGLSRERRMARFRVPSVELTPEDIDLLVLSHLHFDQVGNVKKGLSSTCLLPILIPRT